MEYKERKEYHPKVIDGYKIETKLSAENGEGSDIYIIFMRNGEEYVKSTTYKNVPYDKEKRIRECMLDWVTYNLNCSEESEAISYLDMLVLIDDIIDD